MKLLRRAWQAVTAVGLAAMPLSVLAQAPNPFVTAGKLAGDVGKNAGVGEQKDLTYIIGQIINVALGFLGVVLLVYLLYGGFLWMTSGGSEDGVKKAQTMIKNAVIGLVIIVAAFAISNFVLGSLVNATGNT
ncbi:MAG: hypothetical protein AAB386_05520 [Patescibacteria group bacterium]